METLPSHSGLLSLSAGHPTLTHVACVDVRLHHANLIMELACGGMQHVELYVLSRAGYRLERGYYSQLIAQERKHCP